MRKSSNATRVFGMPVGPRNERAIKARLGIVPQDENLDPDLGVLVNLLVYASYWFVMEPPQAHAFYVLAPLALLFTAFWWTFVDSTRARQIAAGVLALNVAVHAGLALTEGPELSLYKNREVVAAAVRLKSPEMFAHRRDFAVDGGPIALSDPSRAATWSTGHRRPRNPRRRTRLPARSSGEYADTRGARLRAQ